MSFSYPTLQLLHIARDKMGDLGRPLRLASLGYPDVLLKPEDVAGIFTAEIAARLQFREDSEEIIRWHGLQGKLERVIDAEHFLKLLNIELTAIDIVKDRGCERIVDLNEPLPQELIGAYDIVIDGGTTEHCFNIGQALKNVALMTRVGGHIIQGNGMNNYNHGFYGLSPTCYHDFYSQNDFKILYMSGYSRRKNNMNPELFEVHPFNSFHEAPVLSGIMVLVRKLSDKPIAWPMQTKYLLKAKSEEVRQAMESTH